MSARWESNRDKSLTESGIQLPITATLLAFPVSQLCLRRTERAENSPGKSCWLKWLGGFLECVCVGNESCWLHAVMQFPKVQPHTSLYSYSLSHPCALVFPSDGDCHVSDGSLLKNLSVSLFFSF